MEFNGVVELLSFEVALVVGKSGDMFEEQGDGTKYFNPKEYRVSFYTCPTFPQFFCRQNRIKREVEVVFLSVPCGAIRLPKF